MPAATPTDANGKLVVVGNGASIMGKVLSVTGGNAVIELSDAYFATESLRTQVTVPCYNIREQKSNS